MAGTIMPNPKFLGFDNNGDPLSGGKLYTYEAGTSTPQDTYSDVNLTTPNTNPVILDTGGRATVFLSNSSYKFVLKDSNDVTIWTQDNISAFSPQNLDIQGTAGEVVTDGAVVYLSDGSGGKTAGKWYLADADNAYSSSTPSIAIVTVGASANATVSLRLQGSFTYSSALTPGTSYYTSATAGELSATPGTYDRFIGVAEIDGFTLIFAPNPPNVALSPTFATVIATQAFVLNNQTTAGVRLDLESGSLAVREGDDSAYASMLADDVTVGDDLIFSSSGAVINFAPAGSSDITITHSTNTLAFAGAATGYTFADGPITNALGAVGTPSYTFTGDLNTGVWSPAADTVAVSTGGTERVRLNGTGNLILGSGEASATVAGNTFRAPNAAGTDIAGANLTITAGNGTGTGGSGYIAFQTAAAGSTGSTANTMTERMRIDSAGNVGIAATPGVWDSNYRVLRVADAIALWGDARAGIDVDLFLSNNVRFDGSFRRYIRTKAATEYKQYGGEHYWYNAPSGTAGDAITLTERMRITSTGTVQPGANDGGALGTGSLAWSDLFLASGGVINFANGDVTITHVASDKLQIDGGNVGIGVTPSAWGSGFAMLQTVGGSFGSNGTNSLYINNNAYFDGSNWKYTATAEATRYAMLSGEHTFYSAASGTAGNTITFTERARITSAGYFKAADNGTYVGATGTYHEFNNTANNHGILTRCTNASQTATVFTAQAARNTTNGTFNAIDYYNTGAGVTRFIVADSGNVTNTNNSYGQISDQKLKQDIIDAASQWDDIKQVRVRKFRFKNEPAAPLQIGVVAQELEQVSPGLVEERPDYDREGTDLGTTTKSVKYSVLYMKAIKALQEAMARIEALEARLN